MITSEERRKQDQVQRYRYPFEWRAMMLGVPILCAALTVWLAAGTPIELGSLAEWLAVAAVLGISSAVACAVDTKLFGAFPTEIRIEGEMVSLYRFGKYAQFRKNQIGMVERNVSRFWIDPFAGRWMQVTATYDADRYVFYIGPWIGSLADLESQLDPHAEQETIPVSTDDEQVFEIPQALRVVYWLKVLILILALGWSGAAGILTEKPSANAIVFGALSITMLVGSVVYAKRTAERVEFCGERIVVGFPLGRRLEISRDDIMAIELEEDGGYSVRLHNGPRVWLSPFISHIGALAKRLRKECKLD